MNAIQALWKRQIIKYVRSKSRLVGSLGQPLMFLIAFGFGFNAIYQKAEGGANYFQFLSPGIISMSILFMAFFSGVEIIWDRKFAFLREVLVAPVARWEIVVGKTLGGATIACFQGILVFIITLFLGFKPISVLGALLALVFMFLIAFMCSTLGILIASNMEDTEGFPVIMNFVVMPLYMLSGAFFPISTLPEFLQIVVKFNPIAYGVDGLRGAATGAHFFPLSFDFAVLGGICIVSGLICTYFFSKMEA